MNNKGKLATDELNQMYANANGELAVALAKENQAYADSSSELMKDFNKALTESQQQYYSAQAELTVRFDEDMAQAEKTRGAVFCMIGFAAIAVAANAFHTFDYWSWDWAEPRMWAGVILAISAPIAIISASKMASRVVFAKAISL
jgi:hypothetical protein